MNGRPAVEKDEQERIAANLPKFLPHLRPARAPPRREVGLPLRPGEGRPADAQGEPGLVRVLERRLRAAQVGASEGDRFKYKPWRCALFPSTRDRKSGEWYVRPARRRGEAWDSSA
jgi:hypothetical protein